MKKTGERQVATSIDEVRADHRARYQWVSAQLKRNDNVLDAGCGIGYGSSLLAKTVQNVVGLDSDEETIAFAKMNWAEANIKFQIGNLHFLELDYGTKFDAIIAFEVLEHLVRPEIFLSSLKPYIKNDTKIFVSSPNQAIVPHTVELNPYHIQHFTPDSLSQLMRSAGYDVLKVLSQDADELFEGESGRTVILQCSTNAWMAKDTDNSTLIRDALSRAEREMNARSQTIRELQSRLRVREKGQPEFIEASIDNLSKELRERLEAAFVNLERRREQASRSMEVKVKKAINTALDRTIAIHETKNKNSIQDIRETFNVQNARTIEAIDKLANLISVELIAPVTASEISGGVVSALSEIETRQRTLFFNIEEAVSKISRLVVDDIERLNVSILSDHNSKARDIIAEQHAHLLHNVDLLIRSLSERVHYSVHEIHEGASERRFGSLIDEIATYKADILGFLENRFKEFTFALVSEAGDRSKLSARMAALEEREKIILIEACRLEKELQQARIDLLEKSRYATEIHKQNKALVHKINQLSYAMTTQTLEIKELKDKEGELTFRLTDSQGVIADLQRSASDLSVKLELIEAKKDSITERYKDLTQTSGNLSRKVVALEQALHKATEAKNRHQEQLSSLKERVQSASRENERLQKLAAQSEERQLKLRDAYVRYESKATSLAHELSILKADNVSQLDKQKKEFDVNKAFLQEENAELRKKTIVNANELASLIASENARLSRFDPERPTIRSLIGLVSHYHFFVGFIIKAPFYTIVDVFNYLNSKKK